MMGLWLGIALFTLLAIAIVLVPFLRARRQQGDEQQEVDRRSQNIAIYQERLAELEKESAAGNLDQDSFNTLKLELERNLLEDVSDPEVKPVGLQPMTTQTLITVCLIALLIPVVAIGIYAKHGRMADLELAMSLPVNADPFNGQTPTMDEAIAQLQARLDQTPENPEGWYLLANTYMGQENFAKAAENFAKALQYLPKEAPQVAHVQGLYAQALYFANDGQMTDQIRAVVDKTLAIEPLEITALGLLGINAYENRDFRAAMDYWLKALPSADGEQAESLKTGIRSAREQLIAAGESVPEVPELKQVELRLSVSLNKELMDRASPDLPVFIFARPVGGRMPLAALRLTVGDLPANVVLDDSLAMQPQARLSLADQVEVVARISTSGELKPQAGDLMGKISPVAVHDQVDILDLSIDQVVE